MNNNIAYILLSLLSLISLNTSFAWLKINNANPLSSISFQWDNSASISKIKTKLINLCIKTQRGLIETPEERKEILDLFEKLEKLNPRKDSLSSEYLSAVWQLEYTTSDSILGRGGFKKIGEILQVIDTKKLVAENSEVISFFGIPIPRKVNSILTPLSKSKVRVQFQVFTIGPLKIKAPASAVGELDITYIDKDTRLSRGDKGSIFVLRKFQDLAN